jgi:tetratricopeptide (TPR) repeat protein
MAALMGDYERSQALEEESLAAFRNLGDKRGIAMLLENQGTTSLNLGEFERAQALLEESLALRREMGERGAIGYLLRCLSDMASSLGDYARARALLEDSLTFARERGLTNELAAVLRSQAAVARRQGEMKEARSFLQESLLLLQTSRPSPDAVAVSLEELAMLDHGEKRLGRAAGFFAAAAKIRQEFSSPASLLKRQEFEQCVEDVRASLGEAAFALAWAEGQAMPLEQAIAEGLAAAGADSV